MFLVKFFVSSIGPRFFISVLFISIFVHLASLRLILRSLFCQCLSYIHSSLLLKFRWLRAIYPFHHLEVDSEVLHFLKSKLFSQKISNFLLSSQYQTHLHMQVSSCNCKYFHPMLVQTLNLLRQHLCFPYFILQFSFLQN